MSAIDTSSPATPARRAALSWSIRRELWENRAVTLAPLAVAAIFVVGYLARLVARSDRMVGAFALEDAKRQAALQQPYLDAALALMATQVVVGIFYSLDALYAERRDRSVLFWKSLPVSDWTTVLAKASVPIVFLPLFATAVTILLHLIMLLMGSVAAAVAGLDVAQVLRDVAPAELAGGLLYHMVTIHALWYAPIFAWLLLASAWARRAPFLWAGIPIVALAVIERLTVGSSTVVERLKQRAFEGPARLAGSSEMAIDPLSHITPGVFFGDPELWVGLALTALFLAGAVWIRRYRGPNG